MCADRHGLCTPSAATCLKRSRQPSRSRLKKRGTGVKQKESEHTVARLKVDSKQGVGCRRYWIAAPLMILLGACDSAVMAPKAFDEDRCVVPAALAQSVYTHAFPSTSLRPALQHAAGPMASVLGEGELTNELREAVAILGQETDGPTLHDTHCRLVVIASAALRRMPDTPETLPDRDGIRLVLALLANALVTEKP
jgi:hypothetical protein